jgi:hypothetical protein
MMKSTLLATSLALALALPMAAQAGDRDHDHEDKGIAAEIRDSLSEARKEVRVELAKARKELETENLRIDDSLRFGEHHDRGRKLPRAEITPAGDLLVEGKAQSIDAGQRRELLAYRRQVVGIALRGVAMGQEAAEAALEAVGDSVTGMLFDAFTGRLESKVERVVEARIQPMVLAICKELPAVRDSQQHLAASVPAFAPYATIGQDDIDRCEADVRDEFAAR